MRSDVQIYSGTPELHNLTRYEVDEIQDYYKENYEKMIKIARNKTRKTGCAEEVVQETFFRAIKYGDSFSVDKGSLDNWINGILSRCINDWLRGYMLQGREVEFKEEELTDEELTLSENIGEDNRTMSEIKAMVNAISSESNRQICYLHFIEQHTPREIKQVIDVTPDAIRSVLKRFRKDLQVVYG